MGALGPHPVFGILIWGPFSNVPEPGCEYRGWDPVLHEGLSYTRLPLGV